MNLTLGWLYPELMSTYGDRGNIFVFNNRCKWRGINLEIKNIDFASSMKDVQKCDLIFGGGAQDRQQGIVIDDLRRKKGPVLKEMFNNKIPGLFVCGAPQLLGHYYETGEGEKLEGLGIFDMVSKHFGKDKARCIGNLVCELNEELGIRFTPSEVEGNKESRRIMVGFENHGGRTYLGEGVKPLAKVLKGFGNNGEDGTEGAIYNHCLATYSHGPFLPKNPHIADWLITKALEIKYKKTIKLKPLDDTMEWKAHDVMLRRLGVGN